MFLKLLQKRNTDISYLTNASLMRVDMRMHFCSAWLSVEVYSTD